MTHPELILIMSAIEALKENKSETSWTGGDKDPHDADAKISQTVSIFFLFFSIFLANSSAWDQKSV